MAIMRVHKTKDYTVMSNVHFREREMSLKAKGLLSLMLSLPDEWDYSIAGLVAICKENETAIKSTLNELKRLGYLSVTKLMPNETDSGRIEYVYDIFEKPNVQAIQDSEKQAVEKQGIENLGVEIQAVENQGQYNTNISNTKELITNNKKERKTNAKTTINSFDALIEKYSNDDKEVENLLKDWLKVRKAKRAALTDRAIELNLQKLNGLATESNMNVSEYLKEVIRRGWQAFYKINDYSKRVERSVTSGGVKKADGSKYAQFS